MNTTERAKAPDSPALRLAGEATEGVRLNAKQRDALDFLRSRSGADTKILVGDPSTGKSTILKQFRAELGYDTIVLTGERTGTTLMTSLLRSAGLNPEKLSSGVRKNLLTVFLEHQKTIGRRVMIVVDAAERLDHEDWSELQRLHTLQREERADLDLIIAGRPKVYEHLRSPLGRWQRVQARFHILRPINKTSTREVPADSEHLIITQYGEVIDRPDLKSRMLIGRSTDNDICLNHPSVSRHHAVIANTPDGYYVADLHSKNGLTVNGQRVASAMLRNDDVLALGPYRLKLSLGSAQRPRSKTRPLADTATMRVKQLRRHLESSLLGGVKTSAS